MKTTGYSKQVIREELPEYFRQIEKRLKQGAQEYGDDSFYCQEAQLMDEISEELLDVAGWAFILWHRIERIRKSIEANKVC